MPAESAASTTRQVRVLFLAASPSDITSLAIGEEQREIDRRLRATALRDAFALCYAQQLRTDELAAALLRYKPAIVHFSGHGSAEGELLLVDPAGKAVAADPGALAKLFDALSREVRVRCVVLHACYSDALAAALTPYVDCVVGVPGQLRDRSAIAFSGAFYEALGYGATLRAAFDLAAAQALLHSPTAPPPQTLHARAEVALDAIRLVDDAAELTGLAPRPSENELTALTTLVAGAATRVETCRRACLAADPVAPPEATASLPAMLRHLAGFSTNTSVPPLAEFALRLASTELAARDALLAWAHAHATQHGRDPAAVTARWNVLDDASLGRHCLMVVLDEDETGRYRLRAWVGREQGEATPVKVDAEPVALDALVAAVDGLLFSDEVYAILVATGERLLVELIVPLKALVMATARAFAEADFARDHDVVVRWRERVYERIKRPPRGVRPGLWQRRWEHLQKGDAAWAPATPEALFKDECAALALAPVDDRAAWLATLERALQLGVPVVAWLSDGAPTSDALAVFQQLTSVAPGEALSRASAVRQSGDPCGARYLALLWDDPRRLPPDARPRALLAAPSPT